MMTSNPASLAPLQKVALLLLFLSLLSHTIQAAPRTLSHHRRHIHSSALFQSRPESHNSRFITTEATAVFQQWKDRHITVARSVGKDLATLNTTTAKIEADALLAIKSAIRTDLLQSIANWAQHSNFVHCVGWQGVTFDAMDQVVGLDLCKMELVGSINPIIGNLMHLSFLNLSTNSLFGPLLFNFIWCQALTIVELSANSLNGELSSKLLYTFPQLHFLNLSYNTFFGPLPEVPENSCRSLMSLFIGTTNISGAIPSSLKMCGR